MVPEHRHLGVRDNMDDLLRNYFTQKYGENYDKKAQEDLDSAQTQNKWANFASNLGDVIAGNKVGSANQYFQGLNQEAKANTVGKYEKEADKYLKDRMASSQLTDLNEKEAQKKIDSTPDSNQFMSAKSRLESMGVKVPQGINTLKDLRDLVGDAKSLGEINMRSQIDFNNQKALRGMDQKFKEKENELNRQNELDRINAKAILDKENESKKKKDPMNLNATDKARFDNALMAIKGIDEMAKALDKGQNTFSIVGDNDYTAASRRATEAYGRMQSGGAINKEEEERFNKTLPGLKDAKDIQRKKLLQQRAEMVSRLNTLGFKPEDVGVSELDFKYGKMESEGEDKSVSDYAKSHGISYNQAMNIKLQRTQNAQR